MTRQRIASADRDGLDPEQACLTEGQELPRLLHVPDSRLQRVVVRDGRVAGTAMSAWTVTKAS